MFYIINARSSIITSLKLNEDIDYVSIKYIMSYLFSRETFDLTIFFCVHTSRVLI